MLGLVGILMGWGLYSLFRWRCGAAAGLVVVFGALQFILAILIGDALLAFVVTFAAALVAAFALTNLSAITRPEGVGEDSEGTTAICECGKEFERQYPGQNYCSRECYLLAYPSN